MNLVATHEATRYPNLQAVNLGCGGATTASMADGPGCSYTTGTQLGDAVAFLRAHQRQVAFVTIDIGADDIAACQSSSGTDPTCAAAAINQISTDLPEELAELKAAGPGVPIYGMNYYDPFLADWLTGTAGQTVATQSLAGTDQLNALLDQIYTAAGASTADPSSLFETDDTDPIGTYDGATVPQDVATVCQWTDACTSPGSIQPDDQGYAELAVAFEQVIDGVSINTTGLPPGSVKTAYSAGLTATGGYAPYKWSVVGGALPAGLHLQAATGDDRRQAEDGRGLDVHRAGRRHQGQGEAGHAELGDGDALPAGVGSTARACPHPACTPPRNTPIARSPSTRCSTRQRPMPMGWSRRSSWTSSCHRTPQRHPGRRSSRSTAERSSVAAAPTRTGTRWNLPCTATSA